MKKNDTKYYVLLMLLMLLMSFRGVCSKTAAGERFLSFRWCLFYGMLLGILGLYAVFWQQILKHVELSRAYACKAVTVVWGMVWGVVFFHESLTPANIIGGLLVIVGVILVTWGEKHDDTD